MANDIRNTQKFADHVIGKVIQRQQHSAHNVHLQQVICTDNHISNQEPVFTNGNLESEDSEFPYLDAIPWYAKVDDKADGMKHGQTTEQESKTPDILSAIESAETQLTNRNYNTVIENIRATIASDREFTRRRQRETQRRYRKRIDDRALHLAKNTNLLKSEIQKLTVKHQVLLAGVPSKTTPWSVVVSYYDLFQNGLKQPKHLQKIKNTQDSNGVHKHFLHTVMNPKVSVNAGFGADALLEDWRLLAQNIEDLDVRIVRLENVDENNIVAYVRGTTTITEAMLRNEFPHLWYDGDGNIWSSFAERLLGRQLVVYTMTRFVWDSSASRIVSAHYTVDLETAMMNLLGNWEDVAYILSMPCTAQGTRRWTGVFE